MTRYGIEIGQLRRQADDINRKFSNQIGSKKSQETFDVPEKIIDELISSL